MFWLRMADRTRDQGRVALVGTTMLALLLLIGPNDKPPPARQRQAQSEGKDRQQKSQESFWQRTTDDPVAVFSLVLDVLTATLAGGTIVLAYYTFQLWRETGRTAERQLRGYVFPDKDSTVALGDPAWAPTVVLRFKNSGQTPVSKARVRMQRHGQPFPLPKMLPALITEPAILSSQFIGPQGYITWNSPPEKLIPAEIAAHKAGTVIHYYQGDVRYVDAFGKHRTTRFLFWLMGGQLAGYMEGDEWT